MRSQRGVAMVEAAIVTPIFLLLLFGIVDLGRYVWTRHVIVMAAAEGGRMAVINEISNAEIEDAVRNYAINGGITLVIDPVVSPSPRVASQQATVTVTARGFEFLVLPGFVADFAGIRDITATATVLIERG
jgi:Flp pilus assembly protein TadG